MNETKEITLGKDNRLEICKGCSEYNSTEHLCRQIKSCCGSPAESFKQILDDEYSSCPLKKWTGKPGKTPVVNLPQYLEYHVPHLYRVGNLQFRIVQE